MPASREESGHVGPDAHRAGHPRGRGAPGLARAPRRRRGRRPQGPVARRGSAPGGGSARRSSSTAPGAGRTSLGSESRRRGNGGSPFTTGSAGRAVLAPRMAAGEHPCRSAHRRRRPSRSQTAWAVAKHRRQRRGWRRCAAPRARHRGTRSTAEPGSSRQGSASSETALAAPMSRHVASRARGGANAGPRLGRGPRRPAWRRRPAGRGRVRGRAHTPHLEPTTVATLETRLPRLFHRFARSALYLATIPSSVNSPSAPRGTSRRRW